MEPESYFFSKRQKKTPFDATTHQKVFFNKKFSRINYFNHILTCNNYYIQTQTILNQPKTVNYIQSIILYYTTFLINFMA